MTRDERVWIVAWAAVLGFCLLRLHNWVVGLANPGAYLHIIFPLYVLSITPTLTMQMLSRYRAHKLLWLMAAGFGSVMAGMASYSGYRAWVSDFPPSYFYGGEAFLISTIVLTCWFVLMPFAEHRLLRQRWWDDYALLFSASWRNTVKLFSAGVFVGLFWALLMLWAGLFKILNISFFYDLFIDHQFVYPVTAMAFGMGLSLYSTKEEALVGLYRASLNILGWLLPLVMLIMWLFLAALPFQGLAPLWKTGHATTLMLTLLGFVVFLFNAAWQDAMGANRLPVQIEKLVSLGLIAMPVYTALCVYSLSLRVAQYGWSVDRIWASILVFLLAIYAIGYAAAGLRRQAFWMAGAKTVNIVAALILVLVLGLTATPLLDPARISVDSQLARLMSKQITAQEFDFNYLRFWAGRYGNDVLKTLTGPLDHPQSALIHEKATAVLKKKSRYESDQTAEQTNEQLLAKLQVFPQGEKLDSSFVDFLNGKINSRSLMLNCNLQQRCSVLSLDMNADGKKEVVLFDTYMPRVFAFEQGIWHQVASLVGQRGVYLGGDQLRKVLEKNDVEVLPNQWKDVRIGGHRYSLAEDHGD